MENLQLILAWLAGLGISAGVLVSIAYTIFRYLGKSWLDSRFAERLEEVKHQQRRELENFRLKVGSLLDRSIKLNQRELEIIPELWKKLNLAKGAISSLTAPLQQHPDIQRMTKEEAEDTLKQREFKDFEIDSVLSSSNMNNKFQEIEFWKKYNRANRVFVKFNNYYVINSIFIDDGTKEKFDCIRDMMRDAMLELQIERQHPQNSRGGGENWRERMADRTKLRKEGPKLVEEIEQELRTRLWEWRDERGLVRLSTDKSDGT